MSSPDLWDGSRRPRLVALCGYPCVGKSTVADHLAARYGGVVVDDGRVLRQAALQLYPGMTEADVYTQEGKLKTRVVCGKTFTHRQLLGDLGNLLERFYGEQFVPEAALATLQDSLAGDTPFFIFPSVRKTQGVTYHRHGGIVLEVSRPGCYPTNDFDHYDRNQVDHTLLNVDNLTGLYHQAERLFEDRLGFAPIEGSAP